MNTQVMGLIVLLSNALTENNRPLPQDFSWEMLLNDLPQYKNLRGLLLRGATIAGIPRSHPVFKELMVPFLSDIRRSRNQMEQLKAIFEAFDRYGVDYMPVKGAIIKSLYPQPEMRMMEDADILIRPEQLNTIQDIMLEMGMEKRSGSENEIVWNHPKLLVELHTSLVSRDYGTFACYLEDSWRSAQKEPWGNAYRMRTEDHYIFLVIHFAKHYMAGHISPKDICDFWVYRNAFPSMDEIYIETELQKLTLTQFHHNILAVLSNWFCGSAATPAAKLITEAVFRQSITDDKSAQWSFSILSNQDTSHPAKHAKLQFLFHKIFPSKAKMQHRYPLLIKKPWLTPIYWFVRWYQIFFRDKHFQEAKNVLLNDSGIEEYTSQRNAVGLHEKL